MSDDDLIFVTEEHAVKLEEAGIEMEMRYVLPAATYNTLFSIFNDKSYTPKLKRRSPTAPFKTFEVPEDYQERGKLLREGTLARRAADALTRRPNPQKCEQRSVVHNFLKTELTATDSQVANVLRYLATKGNVIHPLV